eukprot:CAMPEP_0182587262 /NCGR_PEP_ID=MMETSP1324-20130603/64627_1 /TAXON_ID=236786 /ORGANISM="Florenciella sp., Strain RCC1587" /LENGTH=155 /DNA_ID=CAMNT_0024804239 /DNA_START=89 /DNA_END=557 /DNA_ORIENTATION=-
MTMEEAKTIADSEKEASVADAATTLKKFDTDGSGGISIHEWISVFKGSGRDYNVKEFLDFMDANDINGDSEIDAEEAFLAGDLTDGASYQDTGLVVDPFSRRKLYDDDAVRAAAGASSSSALASLAGGTTAPITGAASPRAVETSTASSQAADVK